MQRQNLTDANKTSAIIQTAADAIRKYCGFNDNEITEYIGNEDSFFQTIPNTSFLKISKSY